MAEHATDPASAAGPPEADRAGADGAGAGSLVDEELLVEEVSIDGMCGVY